MPDRKDPASRKLGGGDERRVVHASEGTDLARPAKLAPRIDQLMPWAYAKQE